VFSFYLPDRKKKIDVEILMNLHVLRSLESEKVVFKKCRVYYAVTFAGDESTSGIKVKVRIWDKSRTQMRFFGVFLK